MNLRFFSFLALTLCPPLTAVTREKSASSDKSDFSWENAIVHLEITSRDYNYVQPWMQRQTQATKTGVVLANHEILTTAEDLANSTLIRVQKQGGGLFSLATVKWIDYQTNLAVLTTTEKSFWEGLQPAELADTVPATGSVHVQRWTGDTLENRKGDIDNMTVDNGALSFVSVPLLQVDATMQGAGEGETVTLDKKVVGLVSAQGDSGLSVIPASFISPILKARAANTYTGLGYFDFTWDTVQNPLCLENLKLPGPVRGVIVKETGLKPGLTPQVQPKDIILKIDGFPIDASGNYHDPLYKKLSLENLSSRNKFAGDTCHFAIWRDGQEKEIDYKLPKSEYSDNLLPYQTFDQDPRYLMIGGFVFVPLTDDYLRSWGPDWRNKSPFRLFYYNFEKVTPERSERVVLAQVLPDEVNQGYEGARNLVIDTVNGIKIKNLDSMTQALKSPQDGFDVFQFEPGSAFQRAVLDATEAQESNLRIMQNYHIPADHALAQP